MRLEVFGVDSGDFRFLSGFLFRYLLAPLLENVLHELQRAIIVETSSKSVQDRLRVLVQAVSCGLTKVESVSDLRVFYL